eukprot:TRINITY_DN4746_c0_g1_i2.p1 TRINITY_DN4746_c0_g1~~TRINITY_DN4746_c0_g1_i2.p1  ORF type:complete len:127 (+),score=14.89 TRINITY_DN4746_c0_g1_i2:90-470(+)
MMPLLFLCLLPQLILGVSIELWNNSASCWGLPAVTVRGDADSSCQTYGLGNITLWGRITCYPHTVSFTTCADSYCYSCLTYETVQNGDCVSNGPLSLKYTCGTCSQFITNSFYLLLLSLFFVFLCS